MSIRNQNKIAAILIGGQGSRLGRDFKDKPKALIEVLGKEILLHQLEFLVCHSYAKVVLLCGHLSEKIENYLKGINLNIEIVVSKEPSPLGTAGAIKNAELLFKGYSEVLVMNGDTLYDQAITDFIECDYQDFLMLVTPVESEVDGGNIRVKGKYIQEFVEKGSRGLGHANVGIYRLKTKMLSFIPQNSKYSLEEDFLPNLLETSSIEVYSKAIRFFDFGTKERISANQIELSRITSSTVFE